MASDFADPYTDPRSGVLRNKLGLTDPQRLSQFEYEASAVRLAQMRGTPGVVEGRFDLAHLQAIHRHVFQDVYDWAGELRGINLSKGGTSFTKAQHLQPIAGRLSAALARENFLQGLPKAQFVDRLAHHYAEWNALHPFREGNGRASREFIGQLAHQAGYELDQTRIDRVKAEWNLAAKRSFGGELGPIRALLAEAIRPARAMAFEKMPEQQAVQRFPELRGAYEGLRAIDDALAIKYPGNAQAQQHFARQARAETLRRLDAGVPLREEVQRDRLAGALLKVGADRAGRGGQAQRSIER